MMECLYGTTAVLVRQSLIGLNWQAIRNLRKVADGPFVTDPGLVLNESILIVKTVFLV